MPIEIGKHMYLFESPKGGSNCLISAHGGYKQNVSSFDVTKVAPGVELFFYGEHSKVLSDPGLEVLSKRPVVVNQHPNPDGALVCDYTLTKYQGSHSNETETYDSIARRLAFDADLGTRLELELDEIMKRPASKKSYESLAYCHVATVRNRWNRADVSLKYAVQEIVKRKPGIKQIHCSFCRSLFGDQNPGVSEVQSRPA